MSSNVYRADGTLVGHVGITATGNGTVTSARGDRTGWVGSNTGDVREGSEQSPGRLIGGITMEGRILRDAFNEGYSWSGGTALGRVSASGEITDMSGRRVGRVSPPIPHKENPFFPDFNSHLRIMGGAALILLF